MPQVYHLREQEEEGESRIMKEKDLPFDRSMHVCYTKKCKEVRTEAAAPVL